MRHHWTYKICVGLVVFLGLIVGAGYLVFNVFELGAVQVPAPQLVDVIPLDQGWSSEKAHWYHTESQGTRIVPLSWFLALEQPTLNPWPIGLLADRAYLSRFGFIYEDSTSTKVPDLPIGFAIDKTFVAPYAKPPVKQPTEMVGLTCASCHTGRLDIVDPATGRVRGLLVEGGSAMISLSKFQEAVGLSLGYTATFPDRFRRFARWVFGKDLSPLDPKFVELKAELDAYLKVGIADLDYAKEHKLNPVDAGFARTDALGLIGNRVFGVLGEANESVTDAPVNFPHLWDTSWFDWVQYNASIRMPMARNIGEALGVGAAVNLEADETGLPYASTVRIENLAAMERALGGENAFEGLQPPRWNEALLGPLNKVRVAAGQLLYERHCQECHYPPRHELKRLRDHPGEDAGRHWIVDPLSKKSILRLKVVDLNEIGTDPNQALNFYRRVAVVPKALRPNRDFPRASSSVETISAEEGLYRITAYIRHRKYQRLKLLAPEGISKPDRLLYNAEPARTERRLEFDRFRELPEALVAGDPEALHDPVAMRQVIEANLKYKARPLDGIWATPPFLHNGSVPSLYQMFVPVEKRDQKFYLGSMQFDPVVVGYSTDEQPGAFLLDTSIPGNLNQGHEFRNLTVEEMEDRLSLTWNGVSTRDERWARVLAMEIENYRALSEQARWEKIREASGKYLTSRSQKRAKGVLGPEFSEEERWQLVEYLKSL